MKIHLGLCLALGWAAGWAAEYPQADTLQLLDPQQTLPENVERLKRAGAPSAEVSLVLAHVLHWWDEGAPDVTNLAPAKAEAVKSLELTRQCARRSWWRDRLIGRISRAEADALRAKADADFAAQLGALLTADERGEYLFRAAPGMAKVRERAWGLGVPDEKLLWLAEAERQWIECNARARAAADRRVPVAVDFDAARLTRVRTALMVLEESTTATYVRRADADFDYWCQVLGEDAALSPEKLLRVYLAFCDLRRAKHELLMDRSITKTQENQAVAQLRATARERAHTQLGDVGFERFTAHELGAWLREPTSQR
ncbi:MAG: hypothetical protein KF715_16780 [Candidatus Didemnitutus sp.]|nr:hypothetical protein [Candidatus Didemnitutus sp.]